MKKKIEKQNLELTPLIEEHNEVILFCERIREGLKNNIESGRIKKYIDWFKTSYLDPHFEIEQKIIFPILGNNNVRVKKALANHRRLNRLFAETKNLNTALHKIEEEISSYISFEERILYNEIRTNLSTKQWEKIEKTHNQINFSDDGWKDRFWDLRTI